MSTTTFRHKHVIVQIDGNDSPRNVKILGFSSINCAKAYNRIELKSVAKRLDEKMKLRDTDVVEQMDMTNWRKPR